MNWKHEWKKLLAIAAVFLWLPMGWGRFTGGMMEALLLAKWYAREHVLLCLVPAFFIAGAIGVFVSHASVMKYLGPKANKILAYGVASVSGSVLAVCSCTILPLFAGIWKMGAGLGPATAFLYAGPAINVLAIILTARILGVELGVARAAGAVGFAIVIGLIMHLIYRKEETAKATAADATPEPEAARPLWQNALFFAVMLGVLVFANWGAPNESMVKLVDSDAKLHAAVVSAPENPSETDAIYIFRVLSGPKKGDDIKVPASQVIDMKPVEGLWTAIWHVSGSLVRPRMVAGRVYCHSARAAGAGAADERILGVAAILCGNCRTVGGPQHAGRRGGRLV